MRGRILLISVGVGCAAIVVFSTVVSPKVAKRYPYLPDELLEKADLTVAEERVFHLTMLVNRGTLGTSVEHEGQTYLVPVRGGLIDLRPDHVWAQLEFRLVPDTKHTEWRDTVPAEKRRRAYKELCAKFVELVTETLSCSEADILIEWHDQSLSDSGIYKKGELQDSARKSS